MPMPDAPPAILCVNAAGLATALRLKAALGGVVHGLRARLDGAEGVDCLHDGTAETLRALYAAGTPILALCATGVVIRALAPMLTDKRAEPPVVAISADGAVAVPLLGGHRGANRLAALAAAATGGLDAATTASDAALGVALDDPPPGWRMDDPDAARAVMAAALAGERLRLEGAADWLTPLASDRAPAPESAVPRCVIRAPSGAAVGYTARTLALGLGCARDAPAEEMAALLERALAESGLPAAAIAGVFTLDLKADEPAVNALAARLEAPLRLFDAARLETETPRLANPSDIVFAEVGCHGVAEAAALAGAGARARLIRPKLKSAHCTVALAAAPEPITTLEGRPRGRLAVVGVGPGQASWRTPEASRLIAEAEELIGYGLYLDLLGPLAAGKARRDFALGQEEARCRYALERAGEGARVALICSGDAGVYAMGALVCELLDRPDGVSDAARRAELTMAPGVSAMQAASARAGALLGHDFCAISLSDLLTPWRTIRKRLEAAAAGDFVVALYNPASRGRRWQLAEARDILLAHRPEQTPVLLASDLGRPAERLRRRTLGALDTAEVDMLTVVLVGSSRSRAAAHGGGAEGMLLYTPRGYAAKAARNE